MASFKASKARAKAAGLTITKIPKRHRAFEEGLRYRVDHFYTKTLEELNKAITTTIRGQKKSELIMKLNGYRLKHGHKLVQRKRRQI